MGQRNDRLKWRIWRFHVCRFAMTTVAAVGLMMVTARPLDAEIRTWSDTSGKYEVEAEFVELDGTTVVLKKSNGSTIEIDFERLSEADRAYVSQSQAREVAPQVDDMPAGPISDGSTDESNNLPDLIERVEKGVVRVFVQGRDFEGQGSGVLLNDQGHIATNFHVVEGATKVEIAFHNGKKLPLLGCLRLSESKDIAILRVDPAQVDTEPLPLRESVPRKGERVVALGAPRRLAYSASEGTVSAVRTGRELAELDGAYQQFDADAQWIQTTAPISPGNSGGPLLDIRGQIVGLNTFANLTGQNLNFAISSIDVLEEVQRIDNHYLPLPPVGARSNYANDDVRIVLPSGNVLDVDALFLSQIEELELSSLYPRGADVFLLQFNSGKPWALVAHDRGKLHGFTLALYETDVVATLANYQHGERHGNVLTWVPTGEKSLFAQFARGRLHGLLCRFKDDDVWLVQEYQAGQLLSSHLVEHDAIVKSHLPESDGEKIAPELAEAHEELERVLHELGTNEADFRKSVMKCEQQRRRLAAAANSVQARSRIQEREDDRREAFHGAIGHLRKRAGMTP